MPQDATAVTIVSISAGAAIALGGGVLNARLARRQAERQFSHERGMSDRAELREYLRHALGLIQETIDYILGLSSDHEALGEVRLSTLRRKRGRRASLTNKGAESLSEELSAALHTQADAISEWIEKLREPAVGLALLLGGRHPVAVSYRDVVGRAIECARSIPDTFPTVEAEREEFRKSWEHLAAGQRDFLELAAQYVGVKLDGTAAREAAAP